MILFLYAVNITGTTVAMRKYNLNSSTATIRVVVLGDRDVGKSALVVRLLTKRFIGEYVSGQELTYQQEVTVAGNKVTAEICDALVKKGRAEYLKQLSVKTDAYMIVYSVCNRESFNYACQLAAEAKAIHRAGNDQDDAPILLVGNKSDLNHYREVKTSEGDGFAKTLSLCHFIETSAAESCGDVEQAFRLVFQLAKEHTSSLLMPNGNTSKLLRKNSITQVAQLIRDHYKKGHLSNHARTNSLERGLLLLKSNTTSYNGQRVIAPTCNGGYPLSPNISFRQNSRKYRTQTHTPSHFALGPSSTPKLSSKCLSLSTLTEAPSTEEIDSRSFDRSNELLKQLRIKSAESEISSYASDESCSTEECCNSQSRSNKTSFSSNETFESSDASTAEEDAFSSETSSSTVSLRDTPTPECVLVENNFKESQCKSQDHYDKETKRTSINLKNLHIDVSSEIQCVDSDVLEQFAPKSAPHVQSTSKHKFRFFPNAANNNHQLSPGSWSTHASSPVPVSPLLNHQQLKIKSPKDKKAPTQNFLKQFFKNSLHSSHSSRGSGSNHIVNASLTAASSEPSLFGDGSIGSSLSEGGPIYFHASSTSLSSIISNDNNDFDSHTPSSISQVKKNGRKLRRSSSFREAVGGLMRKRKQSVSG